MNIVLLSHSDFVKVRQYHIEAQVHGTFPERIKQFNNDIQGYINTYGYCPKEIYDQKALYIKEWKSAWKNSCRVCIDVTTGEIDEPCK